MNTTTRQTLIQRATALLLAATATVVMLISVDGLAQHDAAADASLAQRVASASAQA